MSVLYLRFLIGGLNVVFVVVVATVTLALALSISFASLRDNADIAVTRLGTVTGKTVDNFFATPQGQLDDLATTNLHYEGFSGLPSESPTFGHNVTGSPASGGGEMVQVYRQLITNVMVEVDFKYTSISAFFVDGTYFWQVPLYASVLRTTVFFSLTTWPTGPLPGDQHDLIVSGHTLPTGAYSAPVTNFVKVALTQMSINTDLRRPEYRAVADGLCHTGVRSGSSLVSWGQVYFVATLGLEYFFLPLSRPIVNSSGFMLGYVQLVLRTDDVSALLTEGQLTPASRLVIYDTDGFLFGASSQVAVFTSTNFTGPDNSPGCTTTNASMLIIQSDIQKRACRYHLRDTPVAIVRSAVKANEGFFTNGSTTGAVKLIGSQYVYVQRLPTLQGSRAFTIAMVVPEEDMIGDAEKILPICAGVTAGVVVIAALLSFAVLWFVLRPLQGIAERMGKAARLEEDDAEVPISSVVEIGDLQRAFIAMRDELGRIRAFVPQSLLHANDDDDDEGADPQDHTFDRALRFPSLSNITSGSNPTGTASSSHAASVTEMVLVSSQRKSLGESVSPVQSSDPGTPPHDKVVVQSTKRTSRVTVMSPAGSTPSVRTRGKLQLASCVKQENVSVLCLNLAGYHGVVKGGLSIDRVAATVETVLRICHTEKGVVESFHGDRFLISFNAVKPAMNHSIRAAVVAARIADALEKSSGPLGDAVYTLPVTCGVATGAAQVGNLGSDSMKRFSIVGPVVSQAACLERLCKMHAGVSCLAPQRMFTDLRIAVLIKIVDYSRLPFLQHPVLLGAVLREHVLSNDDEWMYQLHNAAAGNPTDFAPDGPANVQANNEIWEQLFAGRVGDATASLSSLERSGGHPMEALQEALAKAAVDVDDRAEPAQSPAAVAVVEPSAARSDPVRLPCALVPRDLGPFFDEAILGSWR